MKNKMIKKIICGALVCLCVASLASCSCSGEKKSAAKNSSTVETQPERSKEITSDIQTSEYAYYIPKYEWTNTESGDTLNFENSGSFSGMVNGTYYSGRFTLKADEDILGRVDSGVTLDGKDDKLYWTIDFKTTTEIYVTTSDGNREFFAAKWWLDEGNEPSFKTDTTYTVKDGIAIGYYYDFLTQDWKSKDSKNTFKFNVDGSFEGKIKSKSYKGSYKISSFGKNAQTLELAVNKDNKGKIVVYTVKFDDSKTLKITTDTGKSESFTAE